MNEIAVQDRVSSRRTSVNLACNLASHAISAVIAFFLTPYLTRTLGLATYGFYPVAVELMGFFALFSGLSSSTATRYIAIEAAGGRRENARKYFSTVFFANAALSAILMLPMGATVIFCDRFLNIPDGQVGQIRIFFLLMLLSVLVDAVFSVFMAAYSVSERLDLHAGQQLIGTLVKAGLLWFLMSVFRPNIVGIGVAVLGASLAMGIVGLIMSGCLMRDITISVRDVSLSHLRQVVASGFWYSVWRFGAFCATGAYLFAANILFGASEGGTYSVALTVSRVCGSVLLVMASVFLPVMEKRFAENDRAALCASVIKGQKIVGFGALVAVAVCIGFCREFFSLWLGADNTPTLRLLTVILAIPALSAATALPIVNLSLVVNRMRRLSLLFLGGALLSLAAAIALRTFFGCNILLLSGVSALVQILWYSGIMPLLGARFLGCSPFLLYRPVLRAYFGCALSVAFLCAVKAVFAVNSWLKLGLMFLLCLVAISLMGGLCLFKSKR